MQYGGVPWAPRAHGIPKPPHTTPIYYPLNGGFTGRNINRRAHRCAILVFNNLGTRPHKIKIKKGNAAMLRTALVPFALADAVEVSKGAEVGRVVQPVALEPG